MPMASKTARIVIARIVVLVLMVAILLACVALKMSRRQSRNAQDMRISIDIAGKFNASMWQKNY
jgi:hypothetical protein